MWALLFLFQTSKNFIFQITKYQHCWFFSIVLTFSILLISALIKLFLSTYILEFNLLGVYFPGFFELNSEITILKNLSFSYTDLMAVHFCLGTALVAFNVFWYAIFLFSFSAKCHLVPLGFLFWPKVYLFLYFWPKVYFKMNCLISKYLRLF